MSMHLFAALVALSLFEHVAAQKENSPCIRTFRAIFTMEAALTEEDTKIFRTYTICPNTLIEPGVAADGEIANDDLPLSCKENCLVRCGRSGSSSNNCKIDGTGSFGVFQVPLFIFPPTGPNDSFLVSAENVSFQGFTLDFFVSAGQSPVILGSPLGSTTFIDWKFSNNNADPFFVCEEFTLFDIRRSAAKNWKPPGYVQPSKTSRRDEYGVLKGGKRRHLDETEMNLIMNEESNPLGIMSPQERAAVRRESYADKYIDSILMEDEREDERQLQRQLQNGKYQVNFVDCLFDFNDPVRQATTQFGLSILRFSGSDVTPLFEAGPDDPPPVVPEYVAEMDVRLIRNEFVDNIYFLSGDRATYRSIIDFHSHGRLTLRQNCFRNNPVKNFGVVTVYKGPTLAGQIINTRNFLQTTQTAADLNPGLGNSADLRCSFFAFINEIYEFVECGGQATANSCRANVATAAPSAAPPPTNVPFACFPGDSKMQVEGRGQVLTKDVRLGDKVLVGGGKYEAIYSFGHLDKDVKAEYLKITTAEGSTVEMSRGHMVYVQGERVVPASTIKVGDQVQLANGEYSSVKTIQVTHKQGAYAPFTTSGVVIVNNIMASSFIAFQESESLVIGSINSGLTFQFLAHTFERPHRAWCQYFSACTEEKYSEDGISTWVAIPHKIFQWFHEQSPAIMALLMGPVVLLFAILASPVTCMVTLLVTILGAKSFRPTMRVKCV